MKKLFLLVLCTLVFTGCEIEDDEPYLVHEYAEVTGTDLPEFFERGKLYEITVTYALPTACHSGSGLEVNRGSVAGEGYRDIYIAGVASHRSDLTECNEESEDLEREVSFTMRIDQSDPYTFYLWEGVDIDDKNIFTEVEVPVVVSDSE